MVDAQGVVEDAAEAAAACGGGGGPGGAGRCGRRRRGAQARPAGLVVVVAAWLGSARLPAVFGFRPARPPGLSAPDRRGRGFRSPATGALRRAGRRSTGGCRPHGAGTRRGEGRGTAGPGGGKAGRAPGRPRLGARGRRGDQPGAGVWRLRRDAGTSTLARGSRREAVACDGGSPVGR